MLVEGTFRAGKKSDDKNNMSTSINVTFDIPSNTNISDMIAEFSGAEGWLFVRDVVETSASSLDPDQQVISFDRPLNNFGFSDTIAKKLETANIETVQDILDILEKDGELHGFTENQATTIKAKIAGWFRNGQLDMPEVLAS